MNNFVCGCNYNNKYKTDCYFYTETPDMGATIKMCLYDLTTSSWGKCECSNCKNYFPKANVDKIIRDYIKKTEGE